MMSATTRDSSCSTSPGVAGASSLGCAGGDSGGQTACRLHTAVTVAAAALSPDGDAWCQD